MDSMDTIRIRGFEPRYAEDVSRMLRNAFFWYHRGDESCWLWKSFSPENILRRCSRDKCLIALKDNRVVGFISFSTTLYKVAYVSLVAVDPEYWGKGVASLLLDTLEEKLRAEGFRKIWLMVTHVNRRAVSFYLKKGFVPEGILRDHTAEGLHEIIMSKKLNSFNRE
ncbi:MAG: GNAT family N-acetyltransferase [Thermoproteales archaeon]|nr:GNAT family N-acetyltransferase [Thermoproteales archaeon]RLE66945.1 MAG: hypothetical protein DRJ47_01225 [Thermoprotei archaeon]